MNLEPTEKTKEEVIKVRVDAFRKKLHETAFKFSSDISELVDIVFEKYEGEYIAQEFFDEMGLDGNTALQMVGGAKQLLSAFGVNKYPVNPARQKLTPTPSGVQVSELDNPIEFIN